jgi:hypothetical protein
MMVVKIKVKDMADTVGMADLIDMVDMVDMQLVSALFKRRGTGKGNRGKREGE